MPASPVWIEVAADVFRRRYDPEDVTVGAVLGPQGITVVDTRNTPAEADEILRDLDERFGLPVVAAVNTHAHYDHTFGNQVFADRGIPVFGHHLIPRHFAAYETPWRASMRGREGRDLRTVTLTPPTVAIDAPTRIDPGGRMLELVPVRRGHTDTDLAVHVPDTGVWFVGDIVEQSGPPMFGPDSFPLEWPEALRVLGRVIGSDDVIVPGHGDPLTVADLEEQRGRLAEVAAEIRLRLARGADDAGELPAGLLAAWPKEQLRVAIRAARAGWHGA